MNAEYLYLDNPPASLTSGVVYRQLRLYKEYDYTNGTVTEKTYDLCATETYYEKITNIDGSSAPSSEGNTKTIEDLSLIYFDSSNDDDLVK